MEALKFVEPGNVQLVRMQKPRIGAGEVLVQTAFCGICATDVKTYLRGHPKIKPGAVLGHEISGTIVESNQTPDWQPGNRVVVAPYAPCGSCYFCQRGNETLCEKLFDEAVEPGGFAGFVRVPARLVRSGLYKVPDELSLVNASLAEPLACCIHGLEALQVGPQDTLLVIGDGPMGLLQAQLGRIMGAPQVTLCGMIPQRLELAQRYADQVVDNSQENAEQQLKAALPNGADKVIVSVGDAKVAQGAFRFVRKGGAMNLYAGLPKGQLITIDPNQIHYDEVRLVGTFGFRPRHFARAMEYLLKGSLDLQGMVSGAIALEDIKTTMDAIARHQGVKYIVDFTRGGAEGN